VIRKANHRGGEVSSAYAFGSMAASSIVGYKERWSAPDGKRRVKAEQREWVRGRREQ